MAEVSTPLAVIELLDRDGQVRQSVPVHEWPVSVGRALDNTIVLADPHVAAHHLQLDGGGDAGLVVRVGETRNGAQLGARHLDAREAAPIDASGVPPTLTLGRTRLRLRLPGHAIDPELPLAGPASFWQQPRVTGVALMALIAALLFRTWLESDPDVLGRTAAGMMLAFVGSAAVWCGAWALLSRIFARQAQFGWHVRVFVLASLAYLAVDALAAVLAFALDWTWLADFSFVATLAVAGAALTFHLYAVEPGRLRLMRAVGVAAALGGIALTMWFNQQRTGQLGDDLYLSHLMPPALRLARTVPVDRFVEGLGALQAPLERKAREPASGDGGEEE